MAPALVAAVVAISFAAIFLKLAEPTHALTRSGLRLLMAAALLLPAVARGWRRRRLQPVLGWAVVAGLLYAVHFSAWIWSLDLTSVAASVTLVTATPLLLAVVGVVTGRDRPEGRLWVALALGAAGWSSSEAPTCRCPGGPSPATAWPCSAPPPWPVTCCWPGASARTWRCGPSWGWPARWAAWW